MLVDTIGHIRDITCKLVDAKLALILKVEVTNVTPELVAKLTQCQESGELIARFTTAQTLFEITQTEAGRGEFTYSETAT